MEGKEVIKVVKRINEDKQKTLQLKQDKMKAKEMSGYRLEGMPIMSLYFTLHLQQGLLQNKWQETRNDITSCFCEQEKVKVMLLTLSTMS
jgi:hypothetical protein